MDYVEIFWNVSRSKLRTNKIRRFSICQMKAPNWLMGQGWASIQPSQVFKFPGISFSFHIFPEELCETVLQRVANKIEKWILKPMSLTTKFQIYTNFLSTTNVKYSCWVPSTQAYF